jgi:uncharacterized membrane protein (UPF0127 family)
MSKLRQVRIDNLTRGTVVASAAEVAETFQTRLVGLLGRDSLDEGQGLFIWRCTMIHMFGMRFPIDAVFIDDHMSVIGLVESIAPNKVSRYYPRAAGVIELPVGSIRRSLCTLGDQLALLAPAESAR